MESDNEDSLLLVFQELMFAHSALHFPENFRHPKELLRKKLTNGLSILKAVLHKYREERLTKKHINSILAETTYEYSNS